MFWKWLFWHTSQLNAYKLPLELEQVYVLKNKTQKLNVVSWFVKSFQPRQPLSLQRTGLQIPAAAGRKQPGLPEAAPNLQIKPGRSSTEWHQSSRHAQGRLLTGSALCHWALVTRGLSAHPRHRSCYMDNYCIGRCLWEDPDFKVLYFCSSCKCIGIHDLLLPTNL